MFSVSHCLEGQFGAGSRVGAELAGTAHRRVTNCRHIIAFDSGFHFDERRFNPGIAAYIWNKFRVEFQAVAETVNVQAGVGIDEVTGVADLETILAKQPLVNFQLAFVADLPIRIDTDFFGLAGSFVIHHDELAGGVHPNVINRPEHVEVGWLVQRCDAGEIVSPGVEVLVLKWNRFDLVVEHNRMWRAGGAMEVELFFEQFVDGLVDIERRTARSRNLQPGIQPETAWALGEQFNLRPRNFERRHLSRMVWLVALSGVIHLNIVAAHVPVIPAQAGIQTG